MPGPRDTWSAGELPPTLHKKAAALLYSVARNHALIDGNKHTAWLAMRVFLRFNGVSGSAVPPPVSVAGPIVETVSDQQLDQQDWLTTGRYRGGNDVRKRVPAPSPTSPGDSDV
ncbi:type II toxin-antitoxin system death-on-curing family toxin [Streptomyces tendae]|uniref:type II toxin-antitoxin system death-on-curing family toxin n=1 Tax=Streptomyces tendae TaxID=1932 RepID=UPI00364DA097